MLENPFQYVYEELDASLDTIVFEMYEAHKFGESCNPTHHLFFQTLFSLIPSLPKRQYVYRTDDDDNLIERRTKSRSSTSYIFQHISVSIINKARHIMLPKTLKMRDIA